MNTSARLGAPLVPSTSGTAAGSASLAGAAGDLPSRRWILGALAGAAAGPLLTACGNRPPPPRLLDLGPAPAWSGAPLPRRVNILAVSASELMQGTAVVYRLDYTDPFQRRAYRDSRWAAPLLTLLGGRLKQLASRAPVAAGADPSAAAAVMVDVEDCVQRFSGPAQSEVTLRLTATAGTSRQAFEASAPAGGDAQGAVRAIAQVLDRVGGELLAWAAVNGAPVRKP